MYKVVANFEWNNIVISNVFFKISPGILYSFTVNAAVILFGRCFFDVAAMFVFQPMCALCERRFSSVNGVLRHLNASHPSAALASFSWTKQNKPCLVHQGNLYRCSYTHQGTANIHSWRCNEQGCNGVAHTRGVTHLDVTSVVISTGEHNHPGRSDAELQLYLAVARMRKLADESTLTPLAIYQQVQRTLDPEVANKLPPMTSFRNQVYRRRSNLRAKRDKQVSKAGDTSESSSK